MMRIKLPVATLVVFCLVLASFSPFVVLAAETKTVVVPDDFSTIQEALGYAGNGDTVFVKNGVYHVDENTSLVIDRTVSLIGEDPKNTVILGGFSMFADNDIAVRVAAPNVTISGFTITNCRVAIAIVNYGHESYPSGCRIVNNNIVDNSEGIRPQRDDVLISGNNITNCGTGVSGYNTKNIAVIGNNITENGKGINIGQSFNITVAENNISNNEGGLNMIYYGPYLVYGNNFTKNDWAVCFAEGCRNAEVYGNNISENSIAVWLLTFPIGGDMAISGEGNKFFGNLVVGNTQQISTHEIAYGAYEQANKGTDKVIWDNGTIGNYWDDYDGLDENGDNIGDTPYVLDENNQDNYPLMEPITVPEFPSWIILHLTVAGTLIALCLKRRCL